MASSAAPIKLERDGDVKVERKGQVLVITLNKPERLNALSLGMRTTLAEVLQGAAADPSIRVLVYTGTGRAFSSGADMGEHKARSEETFEQRMATRRYYTPRQAKVYKPSICVVNGLCAGAGMHLVSDCDIVIASDTAYFTDSHVNVGALTVQEPIGLARRVPVGALVRMAILGKAERISAQRAYELNMVSEVLPPDRLMPRAMELADIITKVSPTAVQKSLQLIWESYEPLLSQKLDEGYAALMKHREHPDAKEGPRAFVEKRAPVWKDL